MNGYQWAKEMARDGHRVFPLSEIYVDYDPDTHEPICVLDIPLGEIATRSANSGKRPLVKWREQATSDQDQIDRWYMEFGTENWGMVTGESIVVVDCDDSETVERLVEFEEREFGTSTLRDTFFVSTLRGGHFYLFGDSATYKPNHDIDVKGRGGFVVLPGSFQVNGERYRAHGSIDDIRPLPAWIGQQPRERDDRPSEDEMQPRSVQEGRNNFLTRLAGLWRSEGIAVSIVKDMVLRANDYYCDPPLPEEELRNTVFKSVETWSPGGDLETIRQLSVQPDRESTKFFQTSADRALRPPPEWTYKGLIPNVGVAQIYGASYTGKTFLALDMALAFCNRRSWMGHELVSRRGTSDTGHEDEKDWALYIAAEGSFDLQQRITAWSSHSSFQEQMGGPVAGNDSRLITVEEEPLELSSLDGWKKLMDEVHDNPQMASLWHRIGMVFLDTQTLLTLEADENDNREMGRMMRTMRMVSHSIGAPIILVHHEGHVGGRQRGASSVHAAADCVMRLKLDSNGDRVLEFTKVKASLLPSERGLDLIPVGDSAVMIDLGPLDLVTRAQWTDRILRCLDDNGGEAAFIDLVRACGIPGNATHTRNRMRDILETMDEVEATGRFQRRSMVYRRTTA